MFSHWADFPSKSKVFHDNIAFLFWVIWAIIPDKPWILDDSNKSNIFFSIYPQFKTNLVSMEWFCEKYYWKSRQARFLIFMKNLCMGKTSAFTSNLCNRQTTHARWIQREDYGKGIAPPLQLMWHGRAIVAFFELYDLQFSYLLGR